MSLIRGYLVGVAGEVGDEARHVVGDGARSQLSEAGDGIRLNEEKDENAVLRAEIESLRDVIWDIEYSQM